MNESGMDRTPEYEDIFSDLVPNAAENIVSFPRRPNPMKIPGSIALDLIHRAAELFEESNGYASERLARSELLANEAIEGLKIAHDRVQLAESGRLAAESELTELRDRMDDEFRVRALRAKIEDELCAKLQAIENIMQRAASRMAATDAQLYAAEQRARSAETRATEAENALTRIEEAIQTQILEKRLLDHSGRAAAA